MLGEGASRDILCRRPYLATVVLGVASALLTVTIALAADLPLRDPDGVAGSPLVRISAIVAIFALLDVVPRGVLRAWRQRQRPWRTTAAVVRERWTLRRAAIVLAGLLGFYLAYISYRNLKHFLPFLRPEIFDAELLELDRAMAFGADPAEVLQSVLGTGLSAHLLSAAYVFYLGFVPLSLAAALVWSSDLRRGFWYVTALGVNWLLGAASYYALPSLGPVFVKPAAFADLPVTGVSRLQEALLEDRLEVLRSPEATSAIQSIAGFASLHVSVVFTAALVAQLLGLHRALRAALWTFLGLTLLATIYFGWHYIIDDVAGLAIGAAAVWLGAIATGWRLRLNGLRPPVAQRATAT